MIDWEFSTTHDSQTPAKKGAENDNLIKAVHVKDTVWKWSRCFRATKSYPGVENLEADITMTFHTARFKVHTCPKLFFVALLVFMMQGQLQGFI